MIIKHIEPLSEYQLRVHFENGKMGIFDIRPYLSSEVFIPLLESDAFTKVRNGRYYIEWECGADLSADTLFHHLKPEFSTAPA